MKQKSDSASANLRSCRLPEGLGMTSTLLALSAVAAPFAHAQEPAAEKKKPAGDSTELPEMVVTADGKKIYKPEKLATPKYTVPLRDVPQTVTVIPTEVMQEQGSTNLRDVLKNVPGISIQAGEGGVPPGDNLSIRGFNARTDLFVDGVRDFGGYSRDPFNFEQVEVTKGPSSTNAGRGSTGGSINLSSKAPRLEKFSELSTGIGTDDYFRTTLDVNQDIPQMQGAAFRVNGVYHTQGVPGRDFVDQERWGIAPSITFGLNTDTRFTLSYFHLEQNNLPDYGLPWVPKENTTNTTVDNNTGLPSGIPKGVNFSNWYGLLSRDHEDIQTDIATAVFEHDFNKDLKIRNTTRVGLTNLDLSITAPRFDINGANAADIRRTDWKNRDQQDMVYANSTDIRYDFQTGKIEHQLVGVLELSREEEQNRLRGDRNAALAPNTNLYHPSPDSGAYTPDIYYTGAVNNTTADTVALSLFDTVKLNKQWMLTGGVRADYFDVDYHSRAADSGGNKGAVTEAGRLDKLFSYRGAVTYKPQENGSIYLGYGTSFNPSAEGLALSTADTATNSMNLKPEESSTIELGTKWDLLDDKLSLTGAIFRTDKSNARTEDPGNPGDIVVLDGEQRVQGFEIGFSGQVMDNWRLIGGYTYLNSEILSSATDLEEGNEVSNTPKNSFSLWSVHTLPAGFEVGVGAQYVGERFNGTRSDTRQEAPGYTTFDSMISYKVNENVTLRLNAYNLTDKDYVDRVGGGHFIPGQGRSATLTANIKF